MLCYRRIHLFFTRQREHIHLFDIGIYDSREKACAARDRLKEKEGFCLRPNRFYILKVFRFRTPKLLNHTYWSDGFSTYTYKI